MKVPIFNLEGQEIGKTDLPAVFKEPIREDLILRAFLATMSKKRQPYGVNVLAGKRTSAHYHGVRRTRYTMMGRELARLPRLHGQTVPYMMFRARFVPQAVKGREAHPPKVEKIWVQKINKKERRKAIKSAIAATASKECVLKRGHKIGDLQLPIVIDDRIQEIAKTKDILAILKKIGLENELKRLKKRKIGAHKYKVPRGPLFVITEDKGISKAVSNIPGVDICQIDKLGIEHLAPGGVCGRLTIFTKSAIEKLKGR